MFVSEEKAANAAMDKIESMMTADHKAGRKLTEYGTAIYKKGDEYFYSPIIKGVKQKKTSSGPKGKYTKSGVDLDKAVDQAAELGYVTATVHSHTRSKQHSIESDKHKAAQYARRGKYANAGNYEGKDSLEERKYKKNKTHYLLAPEKNVKNDKEWAKTNKRRLGMGVTLEGHGNTPRYEFFKVEKPKKAEKSEEK